MEEQNEMLKIVTLMMEHVCDHLCRFPRKIGDQEELDKVCGCCQMGDHICNILNTYIRVNEVAKENKGTGKLLNPAGKYATEFAKNHGISITKVMEAPMVKARFTFFEATGK